MKRFIVLIVTTKIIYMIITVDYLVVFIRIKMILITLILAIRMISKKNMKNVNGIVVI